MKRALSVIPVLLLDVLRLAVLLLALALVFILLVEPGILAAPITLLIGWWPSLARLARAWHPSPAGIALFIFAVVVLVAGSHSSLRWLYASLRNRVDTRWPAKWRLKWTVCGHAILACTLVAICCVVLTTHQIYWISKSSDPLLADRVEQRFGVQDAATTLQTEAELSQWDSAKIRESFLQKEIGWSWSRQPATEAIQPVWIEKDDHSLRAIILIPRRPLQREEARVAVLKPGTNLAFYKLDELPQVLVSCGIGSTGQGPSRAAPLLP